MGFSIGTAVPALTVFVQGLLSFFSPCVLPLVPLYVSYLSGGTKQVKEDGTIHYPRGKVMLHTLFFVLGVSFAFLLLGLGFTALGRFFSGNKLWFSRISGVIMILFGAYQLGIFGTSNAMSKERRLPLRLERWAMNPITALLLGFTFSFAWTPCVGPTLGSVLLMVSSADNSALGFLLVGVYTLGFVIPFLAVGLFTGAVLEFFRRKQNVMTITVKLGALLLILMGIMTLSGVMNGITSYFAAAPSKGEANEPSRSAQSQQNQDNQQEGSTQPSANEQRRTAPAPDFTLVDQYGQSHTLSEYKGKTIFLNFWATWCGPCQREMPEIQALYERYGKNEGELVVLGVANPKTDENRFNQDVSQDEVETFLTDNGYTFPVVMDVTGGVFGAYAISAFPTTFMIDKEGNVFGYVVSQLTGENMEDIIRQTMDAGAQ